MFYMRAGDCCVSFAEHDSNQHVKQANIGGAYFRIGIAIMVYTLAWLSRDWRAAAATHVRPDKHSNLKLTRARIKVT